jgi:low temperature requirement protein LtrA
MLASLVMAAALPEAFGNYGMLFAASYVALQVGRNAAAMTLLARDHRLRDVFERLLFWSLISGVLWLAGATLDGDQRLVLWIPALALDLVAPVARYWVPGRGRAATTDWDVEGGHFAERCQLFIIIALGESIVVTGATAADAGLTPTVVACLVVAFLETVALWWLYFGTPTERSHAVMAASDDPGRVARDAYTYLHLPIVAGIIATAAGVELLIAEPHDSQHGVALAIVLGGPALFLLGESLFQWRTTGRTNAMRLVAAGVILGLAPLATQISALALALIVTSLLIALAIWEARVSALRGRPDRTSAHPSVSRGLS